MSHATQYPKYLKAPEKGLYFKIIGPFDFETLRYLKAESGTSFGVMQTESGQVVTSWLEDAGLKDSHKDEYENILYRIREEINLIYSYLP
jgi:hypothetical protein